MSDSQSPLGKVAGILNSLNLDGNHSEDLVEKETKKTTAQPIPATPKTPPPKAESRPTPTPVRPDPEPAAASSAPAAAQTDDDDDMPVDAPQVSIELVLEMFPGAPRSNIETYLPHVLAALAEQQLMEKRLILMALATIRAETGVFKPLNEGISKYNTSPGGHPFDLYDNKGQGSLGNQGAPDGERFKGRGFIQLTGRANYTYFSDKLGMGTRLIDEPDLANDPETAARLLAAFIKYRESKIRAAVKQGDLRQARRLINGGSHGLKHFEDSFYTGLRLWGKV